MIISFLVDNDGYIIQDTIPKDKDGNVIAVSLPSIPVTYEWDDIKNMDRPKYDFNTGLFSDDPPDMDYYITEMNLETDPVLKEELRVKAYIRMLLCAFYQLWVEEYRIKNQNDIFEVLLDSTIGEKCIVFENNNQELWKKSLLAPYEETRLTIKKINGQSCYVGNNKVCYCDNSQDHVWLKSILNIDNDIEVVDEVTDYDVLCYIGNDEILYSKGIGLYLYKKNLNTLVETLILSYNCHWVVYVGNNEIIYKRNPTEYLYKYNLDTLVETQLTTSVVGGTIAYVDNREIVYIELVTNYLYKFNIDTLVSTLLSTSPVHSLAYIGDRKIVCVLITPGNYLYTKSVDDVDNFTLFYEGYAEYPVYCRNLFYKNGSNYFNKIKPDIEDFITNLVKIELGTAAELSAYYTATQTLREQYGIFTPENISDIPNYMQNHKIWIEKISGILGREV